MDDEITKAIVLFFAAAASACTALAAYLKSRSEVQGVKKDREETKKQRDIEMALIKAKQNELERRQDFADSRTATIEGKLDKTNNLLSEIVGMVKMAMRATPGHAP